MYALFTLYQCIKPWFLSHPNPKISTSFSKKIIEVYNGENCCKFALNQWCIDCQCSISFSTFSHLFVLFCLASQVCPMPFGAPESENHTILYIREVALFGMLFIVLKKTLSWCWFTFWRTSVSGYVHFKKYLKSDQIIFPTSRYLASCFISNWVLQAAKFSQPFFDESL